MGKRGKQMSEGSIAVGRETTQDDAFILMFRVHRDYIYRLAHLLLGNAQDAEDATQEVFLRMYKALPSAQPDRASLRTWLTRVTVNVCHTHRRRNFLHRLLQRMPTAFADEDTANADILALVDPSPAGMPEGQALQAELRQSLKAILDSLRPEHRTVLVLHYYLDFPCTEIARILDCPEGTVYSRLHYARRLVQAQIEHAALRSANEVGR
jgi:RNA polymerase sigma-70 factor (ECF subfamily)